MSDHSIEGTAAPLVAPGERYRETFAWRMAAAVRWNKAAERSERHGETSEDDDEDGASHHAAAHHENW
jgi:hypothetical protein